MAAVALTAEQETLWTVALVVGAVVLVVVIGLMTLLLLFLRDVRSGVSALRAMAERLHDDGTAADLPGTAASVRELGDELRLHDEELRRR